MKLLTYLMTSNEEDIIREILEDRVKNFDVVAIIENHSFDKTPCICREFADRYPEKVIFEQRKDKFLVKPYRMQLINALIHYGASDGDWLFQLDADEFLTESPRDIINRAEGYNCICSKRAQFYYTDLDVINNTHWKDLQYYAINWSLKLAYNNITKLFFKNDSQETPTVIEEKKLPYRPIVKHYQYRSVDQIKDKVRRDVGLPDHSHMISENWEDYIVHHSLLNKFDCQWRGGGHSWRGLVENTKQIKERGNEVMEP